MNKVYIYDCDYLVDSQAFNVKAMRVSSYYQQRNIKTLLLYPEDKPFGEYEIYIFKEEDSSPFPPPHIMNDPNIHYCGEAVDFMPKYIELPWQIMATRPNYLFYNDNMTERTRMEKAQFLQLSYKGKEITVRQNFTNSFKGVIINMVEDEDLWHCSDDVILSILNQLKSYRSLVFRHPILLKPLLQNREIREAFYELKFDKIKKSEFKNNYGNSTENIKEILDFISKHKYKKSFKPLKIQSQPTDNHVSDFFRDLEIIDYSKQLEMRINITVPRYYKNYSWEFFSNLKQWSNNYPKLSYIEYMTLYSQIKTNKTVYEIMTNRSLWFSVNNRRLIYLINSFPTKMKQYMFRQWGDTMLDINLDYKYIKKG